MPPCSHVIISSSSLIMIIMLLAIQSSSPHWPGRLYCHHFLMALMKTGEQNSLRNHIIINYPHHDDDLLNDQIHLYNKEYINVDSILSSISDWKYILEDESLSDRYWLAKPDDVSKVRRVVLTFLGQKRIVDLLRNYIYTI